MSMQNKSDILLILPTNSGKTLYLGPGESSSSLESSEIKGNNKMTKLLKSNQISTITNSADLGGGKPC
jgi:hypothetical protein